MKKYIIITGGQFGNKGAEAMTYIAIDEIRKRWPECEPLMYYYHESDKLQEEKYCFKLIRSNNIGEKYMVLSREYKNILKNTEAIIDVSGYAVGSDWSYGANLSFIFSRLMVAKKYNIAVYLMPQSFGPFEFKGIFGAIIKHLYKKYLPGVKVIMARENESVNQLKQFNLNNIIKTEDLVLSNKGIDINNIFKNPSILCLDDANIPEKSVLIIPNSNNYRYASKEAMSNLYGQIINKLSSLGYNIFLTYHSKEDRKICFELKESIANNDNSIVILDREYNCVEYENLVTNFDFIIASRFHAIVHAYRKHIPSIAIGWANKYKELLALLKQNHYFFDIRTINNDYLIKAIENMSNNYNNESIIIEDKMNVIQNTNVFDYISISE